MNGEAIAFHRLTFVPEGDDVVVGRAETGSYAVLPVDGAELLRRLTDGMTPGAAAEWYESTYDESVDLDDFLETMTELGFVRPADAVVTTGPPPRFQKLGQALFSRPAFALYLALVVVWLVALVGHPDLRPGPSMLYFTDSLIVVQVLILASQAPLGFLHECFHMLAGQRLGLSSRLNISNRLTYVVFETRSNGLLGVPRRQRYLPFLAGMQLDLVVLCLLGLSAELTRAPDGSFPFVGRLFLALSFTVAARLGWQFLLYLRTDLYYVLVNALNSHDLHEVSKAIFFNRIRRALGRTARLVDEDQWTERDRRLGRWYGWFLALGYLVAIGLTIFAFVPVAVLYLGRAAHGLFSGTYGGPFWDAVGSLVLIVVSLVLPALLARRKRRLDAGRAPRLLVDPGVV